MPESDFETRHPHLPPAKNRGELFNETLSGIRENGGIGDLIIKLDEENVKGMTLNDAVKLMRGKPNTDITLTIVRKGDAKPRLVTITRDIIQIRSVKSKLLEPGYAYFRVTQFQEHTGEKLGEAIRKHFEENEDTNLCVQEDYLDDLSVFGPHDGFLFFKR